MTRWVYPHDLQVGELTAPECPSVERFSFRCPACNQTFDRTVDRTGQMPPVEHLCAGNIWVEDPVVSD